jgi:hypothetical protein
MKIKEYPYKIVRKLGRTRKMSTEIRVDSWDKEKPTIMFIGKSGNWSLSKNKEYKIIQTKLVSNTDLDLRNRFIDKKRFVSIPDHKMEWYFQIINDKGHTRVYPQQLFKIVDSKIIKEMIGK